VSLGAVASLGLAPNPNVMLDEGDAADLDQDAV
jgi:hypothetical protein